MFPAWSRINDDKHYFPRSLWAAHWRFYSAVDKSENSKDEYQNLTRIATPLSHGVVLSLHVNF
jgi:hypothetical protein